MNPNDEIAADAEYLERNPGLYRFLNKISRELERIDERIETDKLETLDALRLMKELNADFIETTAAQMQELLRGVQRVCDAEDYPREAVSDETERERRSALDSFRRVIEEANKEFAAVGEASRE